MDKKKLQYVQLAAVILVGLNVWVWQGVLAARITENLVYFLDVGQGDGQLIVLAPDSGLPVKIIIDGGRDRKVLNALDGALGRSNNKYVDVVILTHPDLDHFGGLVEVLRSYDVGLFISNGLSAESAAFGALQEWLARKNIPAVALMEGDVIKYRGSVFSVISPDKELLAAAESNEASLVIMLEASGSRVLFTGDIGFPAENALLKKGYDLRADVLKVSHHGSPNSSGENFIAAVRPKVSVIGVGQNRYGHPAPRVLEVLRLAGSLVHRTDLDGTVKIILD